MQPLEEMGKYAIVVIDPPWPVQLKLDGFGNNGPYSTHPQDLPYGLMTVDDIAALPVPAVLDESAIVFCWTTNKHLPTSFTLIKAWGLTYWFTMAWVKNGGVQMPNFPQFNTEWIVVGKKGTPTFKDIKAFNTSNYWPRTTHSVKPEGFYDLLRRVTDTPRLDIFGRRNIAGFKSWGNEAPDGLVLPDHYQMVLTDE